MSGDSQETAMLKVNPDDFVGRFAMCVLCRRDSVQLRFYAGNVVFDEHAMPLVLVALPAHEPRTTEATYARVRCPASFAPLVQLEAT